MAENFFSRLFGINGQTNSPETFQREDIGEEEATALTIQDAETFVSELQSYYYSDICKMQTDLIVQSQSTSTHQRFLEKKVEQEQVALSQIDEILKSIREKEHEYQTVWKKSIYSFYDEIETIQLKEAQERIFFILLKLTEVNIKPELESVILRRLELFRNAWKIESMSVKKNWNPILLDEEDGVETYQIGTFQKKMVSSDTDKSLTSKQLDDIRGLNFEFGEKISTDKVFVYVSSVTRLQLNYMRRTCVIEKQWEYVPEEDEGKLFFDVVDVNDLEAYLKGMLQIILTKRNHAIMSLIIPTELMLKEIREVKFLENKVQVCKKLNFILRERSQSFARNYLIARIDRRFVPQSLLFIPYTDFRKLYF